MCDPIKSFLKKTWPRLCQVSRYLNKPCVWYSHNISSMIKMSNQNITKHGTQTRGLGIMICWCSPDSKNESSKRHLVNDVCSFFLVHERRKHKIWTREDKQLALHCYFRSGPTLQVHGKNLSRIL